MPDTFFLHCCNCSSCRDALLHVCRIHRILSQPRGNALLVGVGGSGRKSLARLAAYIGELKVFSIEITNTYRLQEFREDLKSLYRQAGVAAKPTMFLFDESQVGPAPFVLRLCDMPMCDMPMHVCCMPGDPDGVQLAETAATD